MDNMKQEQIKAIHDEIKAALADIGARHRIVIKTGTMSYNDLYFTVPMKGTFLDAKGSTEEADRAEWNLWCPKFGLTPDMFGKSFTIGGKTYKIVGIKPKARKYPVVGQVGTGGKYVFASIDVKLAMGAHLTFKKIEGPVVDHQIILTGDVGTLDANEISNDNEEAV